MAEPSDEPIATPSGAHLSRLLRLGFSSERDLVDDLVERLRGPGGAAWFSEALRSGRLGPAAEIEAIIAEGGVPRDALRALKDRGNALLGRPPDEESLHCGMAGYFLAIAAGLAHHGELLTRQPREKVDPILRKLAAAAPEPWAGVFRRGAEAAGGR
jgi:hypothetical protein